MNTVFARKPLGSYRGYTLPPYRYWHHAIPPSLHVVCEANPAHLRSILRIRPYGIPPLNTREHSIFFHGFTE